MIFFSPCQELDYVRYYHDAFNENIVLYLPDINVCGSVTSICFLKLRQLLALHVVRHRTVDIVL
jgi:hypothetical protein